MGNRYSRRRLLAGFGLSTAALAVGELFGLSTLVRRLAWQDGYPGDDFHPAQASASRRGPAQGNPVRTENARPGASGFSLTGHRFGEDRAAQVKAYASQTSVAPGEPIDFHVSVTPAQHYTVEVYRLGGYGGAGARLVQQSPALPGAPQPAPETDRAGTVQCRWARSWRLRIGRDWLSGVYLALVRNEAGFRNWVPFVVRDPDRPAALLVVMPTATYQAYNMWPADLATGRSLYYGYTAAGTQDHEAKATAVSHDRPFAGDGLPFLAVRDLRFVQWIESAGYDVSYASSEDLHAGRVRAAHHRGIVFCGHDEYWSTPMRQAAATARNSGTSLLFLAANNCYWRVGYRPSPTGADHRVVVCEKHRSPSYSTEAEPTVQWRTTGHPEQELLGSQYVSMVRGTAPLVVDGAGHWFWAGTGVRDGDRIRDVLWGEADQLMPGFGRPTAVERVVLADSPYASPKGKEYRQHSTLYRARSGAWVFVAGTFNWTSALFDEKVRDRRIERATHNLLARVTGVG